MIQSASSVLLIRPSGFGYDPETATSNAFQRQLEQQDLHERAEQEFDELLAALRHCGIHTIVLDPVDPAAPNAVFPNNWLSTHAHGTVVTYPMCTPSRRVERDPAIAEVLRREGFIVRQVMDLSPWEEKDLFLEGTGSLVLDRVKRLAYAVLSPRTHPSALNGWCEQLGYVPVPFTATMDGTLSGQPIYHTNVVMSIGQHFAVICFDAMPYPAERQELREELTKAGKAIIPITLDQMHHYVGNMLELRGGREGSEPFLFLSETAFQALRPDQRIALEQFAQLVPVAIPTIEAVGGGSVRCMLAEVFLPGAIRR
jgi:hypothetical protein